MSAAPPAYAWDWFARQRLLWRETQSRLARRPGRNQERYGQVSAKPEVMERLRADYLDDEEVRTVVAEVVAEVAFLGRTDRSFDDLGMRNAPRGLRWWWSAVSGEPLTVPERLASAALPQQLELPDVLGGYGDP